jgi:hypothetical protein
VRDERREFADVLMAEKLEVREEILILMLLI